jgi:amino acid permease
MGNVFTKYDESSHAPTGTLTAQLLVDNALLSDALLKESKTEDRDGRKISTASAFSAFSQGNVPTNSAVLTSFLLINTMIGSGILNQPYVFSQSGVLGGVFGFVLASVLTWLGLMILNEAGVKRKVYEYSGLAKAVYGIAGEKAIDYTIIINSLGSHIGYVLVVGGVMSSLFTSWGCDSIMCTDISMIIISNVCFVAPICLLRHFGHFAWVSVFSISSILAVLFLVIIAAPLKTQSGPILLFEPVGSLKALGSIIFSLSCASANFQAYITTEEKSQNTTSWMKITGSAVFIGALMCGGMGLAGYLTFKDDTEGEILDNFDQPGYDFFKAMVALHLIMYIPINFVISRYSLVKVIYDQRAEDLPWRTHVIFTLVQLTVFSGFAILLLSVGFSTGGAFSLILSFTGGVGGTLATFILPSMIYLKVFDQEDPSAWLHTTSKVIIGLAVLIMIGVLSGIALSF